jgi:hypothetical protein
VKRLAISAAPTSSYRKWLYEGYPIALEYMRRRKPLSMLGGAVLFSLITVATFALNVAGIRSRSDDGKTWSSLTIAIDV